MAYLQNSPVTPHFASSTYSLHLFGQVIPGYAAFYAFIANIVVTVVLSLVFNLVGLAKGTDSTAAADYEAGVGVTLDGVASAGGAITLVDDQQAHRAVVVVPIVR